MRNLTAASRKTGIEIKKVGVLAGRLAEAFKAVEGVYEEGEVALAGFDH